MVVLDIVAMPDMAAALDAGAAVGGAGAAAVVIAVAGGGEHQLVRLENPA